jgi:hypothetical protein
MFCEKLTFNLLLVLRGFTVISSLFDSVVNISTWERKIHENIYGPVGDRRTWHIRTNEELNNLYWDRYKLTDIKIRRLEWLGHLIRMANNRNPKCALDAKLEGKRKVGRPKLRWLYDIQWTLKWQESKDGEEKPRTAQNGEMWLGRLRSSCMDHNTTEEVNISKKFKYISLVKIPLKLKCGSFTHPIPSHDFHR